MRIGLELEIPPALWAWWFRGCFGLSFQHSHPKGGVYPSLYPSPWSQNGGAEGRRSLLLPFLGHSVCIFFLYSIWYPIMLDFGANLASSCPPNLEPKSNQNRSKSHPRCIQNRILFMITFWWDFLWISTAISTKNQSKKNQNVNPTTQQPKYRKHH